MAADNLDPRAWGWSLAAVYSQLSSPVPPTLLALAEVHVFVLPFLWFLFQFWSVLVLVLAFIYFLHIFTSSLVFALSSILC